MNYMQECTTLTGLTLAEAAARLTEILPPQAYKAVGGSSAGFTDIKPAWLTKIATEVFGFCGLGWTYSFDPALVSQRPEVRKSTRNGNTREYTVYVADVNYLEVRFAYVQGGEIMWSESIPTNGSSDNDDPGYALRGALTNAIGAAFAKLGWQIRVYMDEVTHENAAKLYYDAHPEERPSGNRQGQQGGQQEQQAQRQASGNGNGNGNGNGHNGNGAAKAQTQTAPATVAPPAQAPAAVAAPPALEAAPVAPATPTAQPIPAAPAYTPATIPTDPAQKIEWAKTVVIPEGVGIPPSLIGKHLGTASQDKLFGPAVLKFLSGRGANAAGVHFTPGNNQQWADLKAAAETLADTQAAKAKK